MSTSGRILINPASGSTGARDEPTQTSRQGTNVHAQRNSGRRVTISDLQYFVAKADSKLKKLRATLGDYDSQDIEHHKVLKTIFSLVKKLLRLPGDDAAKEFLQTYSSRVDQATHPSAKIKMYDSSGSSGSESNLHAASDYFPNIQGNGPTNQTALGNPSIMPQVRQSPFSSTKQAHGNNEVNKSHNIVIKSSSTIKKEDKTPVSAFDPQRASSNNRMNMSANQSDLLSMRDSQQNPLRVNGIDTMLSSPGGPMSNGGRNKSYHNKTVDQAMLKHQLAQGNTAGAAQIIGNRASGIRALDIMSTSNAFTTPGKGGDGGHGSMNGQIQQLFKMVYKLQAQVEESENRAHSFEKFLNHSNPMGMSYVLRPGRSEVTLPVNFNGFKKGQQAPIWLRQKHESLPPFNYSPVPFIDFHKRSFRPLTRTATGDYYEGQWSDLTNKRDGFGYCISIESNFMYEGYWSEGNQHGNGRMLLENGFYEGQFNMNQRHGQGKYVWNSGDHYTGEWVSSMKSGFGRLYSKAENQHYEGHFKNNKKHGEGKVINAEGVVIARGQWRNDQLI